MNASSVYTSVLVNILYRRQEKNYCILTLHSNPKALDQINKIQNQQSKKNKSIALEKKN